MYLTAENSRGGKKITSIRLLSTVIKVGEIFEVCRIFHMSISRNLAYARQFYSIDRFYGHSYYSPKLYEINIDSDTPPKLIRNPLPLFRDKLNMVHKNAISIIMNSSPDLYIQTKEQIKNGFNYLI